VNKEMNDPISTVANSSSTTPDPRGGGGGASAAPVQSPEVSDQTAAPVQIAGQTAALRMTVEPTNDGTAFTYKFYDRATGELMMELPPEKAAKLGESADYTAGQLVSRTA
jgi:hypothetical protein